MITDSKLKSILTKLNAETNMPMDKTSLILKKMAQQNYITRTVERNDGDEVIEWRVGPRGKIEIGTKGVEGLVKDVYGAEAPEDLDKRLDRSLGLGKRKEVGGEVDPTHQNGTNATKVARRGRPRREADDEDNANEDDE